MRGYVRGVDHRSPRRYRVEWKCKQYEFGSERSRGIVSILGLPSAFTPFFQTLFDFRFVTAIDWLIIAALLRQILLFNVAAFVIVAVLIASAATQLPGAAIVSVAQVLRNR